MGKRVILIHGWGRYPEEKLGAESIIEHGMKHFSGDDNIFELPTVLDFVLKLAK